MVPDQPILWATDLHLDHAGADARAILLAQLRAAGADHLIITGDISLAPRFAADLVDIADAARCPLWYVLGNHDHYGASIGRVRDSAAALAERRTDIRWLPPTGVVSLDRDTALVGVDGWADGRVGDALTTPLVLNDDKLIAELAAQDSRRAKVAVKQALADADALRLTTLLDRAAGIATRLIVATHVPPFLEALPTRGRLSHPAWQPLLVCGATGAVLKRFAVAHPGIDITVLSGHTHVEWRAELASNLRVRVGGARYGSPRVEWLRA
jgi:predicted phosphohydrolase